MTTTSLSNPMIDNEVEIEKKDAVKKYTHIACECECEYENEKFN